MTAGPIERILTAADLDGVLEIEAESFNNPTTREWYERELGRPEVCFIYVLRTPAVPSGGILCVLAGGRPGTYQQFGRSP